MSEGIKDPGLFSWNELMTSDAKAAKAFYGDLFGWETEEMDMGEGNIYHMFKLGDTMVGGMMEITPEMASFGVQPHWMSYVNTEDVDASIAKLVELAGKVLAGPMQAGEMGKFAAVMDTNGAAFSFWQSLAGSESCSE